MSSPRLSASSLLGNGSPSSGAASDDASRMAGECRMRNPAGEANVCFLSDSGTVNETTSNPICNCLLWLWLHEDLQYARKPRVTHPSQPHALRESGSGMDGNTRCKPGGICSNGSASSPGQLMKR
jgi:hypothetical protein